MKKVFLLCIALLTLSIGTYAQTESEKDLAKERKEIAKLSRAELNQKASKDARKAAKSYVKEGWEVAPGALPLDKQLDRSYNLQYQYDDLNYPKYLMGEAMSIGENYDAAKMQALELAKENIAGQIQTEVTELIQNDVANNQLRSEDAASVTKSVAAAKDLISQNIGRVITVVELYRVKPDKNKEVLVRIAYNSDMAKEAAKKAIRQDLEQEGSDLQKNLDKILGW